MGQYLPKIAANQYISLALLICDWKIKDINLLKIPLKKKFFLNLF